MKNVVTQAVGYLVAGVESEIDSFSEMDPSLQEMWLIGFGKLLDILSKFINNLLIIMNV